MKILDLTGFRSFTSNIVFEMAAAYREQLEPGSRVFVRKLDDEQVAKYVIGKRKDENEVRLFRVSGYPTEIPWDQAYATMRKKADQSSYKIPAKPGPEDAAKWLLRAGFKEITNPKSMGGKTAMYATGRRREQTVESFKGVVYHGTEDLLFFSSTYLSSDLGHGSHLQSLEGGDAFSVTPRFKVAAGFAQNGGMVIEMQADLQIYYASREEDNLDEIEYPKEVDTVAIPFGRYREYELAVIKWDTNLTIKAVHMRLHSGWVRYMVTDPAIYGEYQEYLGKHLVALFGKDMEPLAEQYNLHEQAWTREDHGIWSCGKFNFYFDMAKPFFTYDEDEDDVEYYSAKQFIKAHANYQ